MTAAEYMDPKRFPLTTLGKLTPPQQMLIDAVNYDGGVIMVERGETMDAEQAVRWAELQEKHAHYAEVAAEIKARARGRMLPRHPPIAIKHRLRAERLYSSWKPSRPAFELRA